MSLSIIKKTFPELEEKQIKRIQEKIGDKCNAYYFLEFLKTTDCNIDDAYRLYKFDEELRSTLLKYVLRFEIQIKSEFFSSLNKVTNDDNFWQKKENYIFKDDESYNQLIKKTIESFQNLNLTYGKDSSYAVAYVISFGTFVTMFKKMNPKLKKEFVHKYTRRLKKKDDFSLLYKYLLCIRALRNRCAHGTHIVSIAFVNQLNQFSAITKDAYTDNKFEHYTVLELTLKYLMEMIYCKEEFKTKVIRLLEKYEETYSKYGARQSITPSLKIKLKK